jgi:hypothetical protein
MRSRRFSFPARSALAGLAVLALVGGCSKDAGNSSGGPGKDLPGEVLIPGQPDKWGEAEKEEAKKALTSISNRLAGGLEAYEEPVKLPGGEVTLKQGPSIQVVPDVEDPVGKGPPVGTITFYLWGIPADPARAEKSEPHLEVHARYDFRGGRWVFESASYTLTENADPSAGEDGGKAGAVDRATFPRLFEMLKSSGAAP